jgi:3-phosphoshikimate 1-carboxyvinyltransferase
MESITLAAASEVGGSITLPGSKSISNRTLLLAALAEGDTEIFGLLKSDDTDRMLDALKALGVSLVQNPQDTSNWKVTGINGKFPVDKADLFLGNAGTAFRPLTAALALSGGNYILRGVPRMHERPIGDLVDALRQAGANIEYLENDGYPPLKISPPKLDLNKPLQIRGNVSSQFLTALLMALPLTGQAASVEVIGDLISKPYIEITLNLMNRFKVQVDREDWQRFNLSDKSTYASAQHIYVEGDASSASYFLAAAAIAASKRAVTIEGIGGSSIQGDLRFVYELEKLGVPFTFGKNSIIISKPEQKIKGFDLDCNHIPDAAMTLAILALFAEGTTTLRNIASWRVKETDRIAAMATELRKVGAVVIEGQDFITITPPEKLTPNAVIDTYDDHRMAMCFSLVCLGEVPITINDPKCVAKTFPDYFEVFKSIIQA